MPSTALIAGMGPGFGEALAWKLAEADYRIAFFARSADYLEERADELREAGHEALAVPTDVTDPAAVAKGFERVREAFGPVDVLSVQVSQEAGWARLEDLSLESFRNAWEVYCWGTFLPVREAFADMRETGGTVLVVGVTPRYGVGEGHGYVSATAAKRALTESLARELDQYGIHVVHAAVDGLILNPDLREIAPEPVREDRYLDPESVAEVCLSVIEQDAGCWTSSLDLRAPVDDLDHLLEEILG
jgi:NAD(P)-dependent dehydrogenase (short-subunit alcohol dehydrogenase family)